MDKIKHHDILDQIPRYRHCDSILGETTVGALDPESHSGFDTVVISWRLTASLEGGPAPLSAGVSFGAV